MFEYPLFIEKLNLDLTKVVFIGDYDGLALLKALDSLSANTPYSVIDPARNIEF